MYALSSSLPEISPKSSIDIKSRTVIDCSDRRQVEQLFLSPPGCRFKIVDDVDFLVGSGDIFEVPYHISLGKNCRVICGAVSFFHGNCSTGRSGTAAIAMGPRATAVSEAMYSQAVAYGPGSTAKAEGAFTYAVAQHHDVTTHVGHGGIAIPYKAWSANERDYWNGVAIFNTDAKAALRSFKQASKNGHADASYWLYLHYVDSANFQKHAQFYLMRAKSYGHPEAAKLLPDFHTQRAAVVIQKYLRGYLATIGRPEDDSALVNALILPADESSAGPEVIAYALKGGDFPWVRVPPPIGNENSSTTRSGYYKDMTHKDRNYVGLTIKNIDEYERATVFNRKIFELIKDFNLKRIHPQLRVNQTLLLVVNLGMDLHDLIMARYEFDTRQAVELAAELDKLHEVGIVHGDIKPENLFMPEGQLELSDCDSTGKANALPPLDAVANSYLASELWVNDRNYTVQGGAFVCELKKDQYAFFSSIIFAKIKGVENSFNAYQAAKEKDKEGGVPHYRPFRSSTVQTFARELPCDTGLQNELVNFLNSPAQYQLSAPLKSYLTSAASN